MYQVDNLAHYLDVQDNNLMEQVNVLLLVDLVVDCSIVE
jgi:hypothetical protein